MIKPSPLPSTGEVFLDARGDERSLRVSWHPEADLVVLSLWHTGTCVGTFRLPIQTVPELIDVLRGGLQTAYEHHRSLLDALLDENPAS